MDSLHKRKHFATSVQKFSLDPTFGGETEDEKESMGVLGCSVLCYPSGLVRREKSAPQPLFFPCPH